MQKGGNNKNSRKVEATKTSALSFSKIKELWSIFLFKLKRSVGELGGMFRRKSVTLGEKVTITKNGGSKILGSFGKNDKKKSDLTINKASKRKVHFQFGLSKEKEYFIEMLSMLLNSGMDISVALTSIKEELKNKRLKNIIDNIKENVESGLPIWKALRDSKLLPSQIVSMVQIGEESGTLSENLEVIAEQQKKDRLFKSKVRSALIYPIIIIILAFVIALGISWFILPRLVPIFTSLSREIPFLTKALIWLGQVFLNWGSVIVPAGIIIIAFLVFFLFVFTPTKGAGQWITYHIPITKKLVQEVELARLGYTLGNLLKVGLPIEEAFEALIKSTAYYNFKKYYHYLKDEVLAGEGFIKSFKYSKKTNKLIPPTIQEMVGSGEQSGKLSETFLAIGEIYEQKTEITAKSLATTIEPVILIFIGLVIMAVALSIIIPIYGLLDVFN